MNRQSLRLPHVSLHRYYSITLLLIVLVIASSFSIFPQASSRGSESTQSVELSGVKFAVPPGFRQEQTGTNDMSFMRHSSESIGLFVAVPVQKRDDKYLTVLSTRLASSLFRGEAGFQWKTREMLEPKVSKYQTVHGTIKGLKDQTFLQIDYVVVKAQGKDIVIGSVSQFGEGRPARFLFDVEGSEYSVLGRDALFQLISSITGEKDNELR